MDTWEKKKPHKKQSVKMLFCLYFSLSASMETEDLKESHSTADPFTLHLHCTTMKLWQGIFIVFGTVCSSYTGMQRSINITNTD